MTKDKKVACPICRGQQNIISQEKMVEKSEAVHSGMTHTMFILDPNEFNKENFIVIDPKGEL